MWIGSWERSKKQNTFLEINMETPCEHNPRELRQALSKSGHRMTGQRRLIYETVAHCKDHPTAEAVYKQVRKIAPKISLATVYNGLEALAESGEIGKIPRTDDAPGQYELRTDVHHHARCVGCHRVWDLESPREPLPVAELLGKHRFKPLGARIEVLVECPVKTNTALGLAPKAICPLDLKNPGKRKPNRP
jgi:Fe2+ or Zn2+ uptake regulation protein